MFSGGFSGAAVEGSKACPLRTEWARRVGGSLATERHRTGAKARAAEVRKVARKLPLVHVFVVCSERAIDPAGPQPDSEQHAPRGLRPSRRIGFPSCRSPGSTTGHPLSKLLSHGVPREYSGPRASKESRDPLQRNGSSGTGVNREYTGGRRADEAHIRLATTSHENGTRQIEVVPNTVLAPMHPRKPLQCFGDMHENDHDKTCCTEQLEHGTRSLGSQEQRARTSEQHACWNQRHKGFGERDVHPRTGRRRAGLMKPVWRTAATRASATSGVSRVGRPRGRGRGRSGCPSDDPLVAMLPPSAAGAVSLALPVRGGRRVCNDRRSRGSRFASIPSSLDAISEPHLAWENDL